MKRKILKFILDAQGAEALRTACGLRLLIN